MGTKLNKKGFSTVEILIVLLVVLVLALGGWLVYKNNHKTKKTTTTTTSSSSTNMNNMNMGSTSSYDGWKTYSNQEAWFTYKYPANWTNTATNLPELNGSYSGVVGKITAPDGSKLTWVFQYFGGKGGQCIPNSGDVAFASGNKCASKEVISSLELPALHKTTNKNYLGQFDDALWITETKYNPGSTDLGALYSGMPTYAANTNSYQICLDSAFNANAPKIGTNMDLSFPCEYWDSGFNAMFPVKSVSDFNSDDAQTAIKIMKSFNTLQ